MPNTDNNKYLDVFAQCVNDVRRGVLIVRPSSTDKEFHFQNWFKNRLDTVGHLHDSRGRNSYPDFVLVNSPKGLK